MTPIAPLEERESVEHLVARTLRELIVDGKLAEGTPLVQRELAQQLGVSPTPVRAGLSQLEREGFVVVTSDRARARPQADAGGLRGDLRGAARARGPRGEARSPRGRTGGHRAHEGDAARPAPSRRRAGRAGVPAAAMGVPRDLLPGERPAAARRRGRAPVLAGRSLQPARPLHRPALPRVRSGATRASWRRASRTTGSGRRRSCRRASAGRSTGRPTASRPRRRARDRGAGRGDAGAARGARRGSGQRRRVRARPPRRRPQLPHAATARPRRLPDVGGRGGAGAGGRRRRTGSR